MDFFNWRWGMGQCADNGNVNVNSSNTNFPNVGGNYNNGENAGMFNCNVNNNSTNSNTNNGSRLASIVTLHTYMGCKMEIESPQPCHLAKYEVNNTHLYIGTLERAQEDVFFNDARGCA